jgi:uncharacterized protein YbbK (DUF523 family)
VPVYPELAIGLGAPRETIRLVRRGDGVRLLGSAGVDHTAAMRRWADTVRGELCKQDLLGFVLNRRSPSCGLGRVRVWDEGVQRPSRGRSVFAQALVDATLPPPTTRPARPPTAQAGTRAPQSDGSITRHEASERCLT